METPLTGQQLIEHSIEKPDDVFNQTDGRIFFRGHVFETKEAFEQYLERLRVNPDLEIIEHSLRHPTEIFTGPDGRIAVNGQIFQNDREFRTFIKIARSKPIRFLSWIGRGFKSNRKN